MAYLPDDASFLDRGCNYDPSGSAYESPGLSLDLDYTYSHRGSSSLSPSPSPIERRHHKDDTKKDTTNRDKNTTTQPKRQRDSDSDAVTTSLPSEPPVKRQRRNTECKVTESELDVKPIYDETPTTCTPKTNVGAVLKIKIPAARVIVRPPQPQPQPPHESSKPTKLTRWTSKVGAEAIAKARARAQKKKTRFICGLDGCQKSFARRNDMMRHQRDTETHRDVNTQKKFTCTVCGDGLSRRDALVRHQQNKNVCVPPGGGGRKRKRAAPKGKPRVMKRKKSVHDVESEGEGDSEDEKDVGEVLPARRSLRPQTVASKNKMSLAFVLRPEDAGHGSEDGGDSGSEFGEED